MGLSAYDIVNLALALVGLVGAFQQLYQFIHVRLPSQKLVVLNSHLNETIELFQAVVEEGVFSARADYVDSIDKTLQKILNEADSLRARTHAARTWKRQIVGWVQGLSRDISKLTHRVMLIRSSIAMTGEEERVRLEKEALDPSSGASSSVPFDRLAKHRRNQQSVDLRPEVMSRHPIFGTYLLQNADIFDKLPGAASALRDLPNPPSAEDIRQMEVNVGGETLQLSFADPEQGLATSDRFHAAGLSTSSSALLPVVDDEVSTFDLSHIFQELQNRVGALNAVANPLRAARSGASARSKSGLLPL